MPLRVLTFTSLFPSEVRPRHGIFVETRLQHLIRDCGVDARVVAPVPWFPFSGRLFGIYGQYAATPRRTTRGGLQVTHPRYPMLPRIGVAFQPEAMARAAAADLEVWARGGWTPEIIDAHYFYPDGVAASLLADWLKIPFVVTARGTDVNVLARQPGPGRRILQAAQRAAMVISVSAGLRDALVSIGVDPARIVVLRNGVDTDRFRREDRLAARRRLNLGDGPCVACVGNLVPEKGQQLALQSLSLLAGVRLVIVGDGPMRKTLADEARQLGIADRVTFVPNLPQEELRYLYAAVDALVLTSAREGWPNVVLESLACGTPVVSVDVGAVGEMLANPMTGRIVQGRDPARVAAAIAATLDAPPPPDALREWSARFDWASISRGQWEVFTRAVGYRVPRLQPGAVPAGTYH